MNKERIVFVVLTIVVAASAFFGGMKFQQSKKPANGNFRLVQGDSTARQRMGQNFRPVSGEVIAKDDKSVTVKLADGSSKIVLLAESTEFLKSESGAKEDLKMGDKVMVVGSENSDGSVTAQNVQINPPVRRVSGSSQ